MGTCGYVKLRLESPPAHWRPVRCSYVLGAGGVVGAVLGPEFAKHSRDLPTLSAFSGVFAVSACSYLLLFVLLLLGFKPLRGLGGGRSEAATDPQRRRLITIFGQPQCAACTFVAAASYSAMVFLMAAVPLAMTQSGFAFDEAAVVVQFHMVAMFAPSFVTGHLVKRFGAPALQLLGATLLAAGGGIMLGYVDRLVGFAASQAAVGVGWNFCFVASTSALSQQTRPSERVAAQAATDLVVFGSSGACSLLAAFALADLGWRGMQTVAFAVSGAIVLAVVGAQALARARSGAEFTAAGSARGGLEVQGAVAQGD